MKILALILARGGSQRVPKKNIATLGSHPLIWHTIRQAKRSKYIKRVIVSTDDKEIAKVSQRYGAETPFRRPPELSQFCSTEHEAIKHALDWLKENDQYVPDLVVKLFPTSPFRTVYSIDKCIELMIANPDADSVRSVRKVKEHPYKMWTIENGKLRRFVETKVESHTLSYQVLPTIYVNNASIDVTKPETIYEKFSVTGKNIIPYVMSEEESFDINTMLDLKIARMLWRKRR